MFKLRFAMLSSILAFCLVCGSMPCVAPPCVAPRRPFFLSLGGCALIMCIMFCSGCVDGIPLSVVVFSPAAIRIHSIAHQTVYPHPAHGAMTLPYGVRLFGDTDRYDRGVDASQADGRIALEAHQYQILVMGNVYRLTSETTIRGWWSLLDYWQELRQLDGCRSYRRS